MDVSAPPAQADPPPAAPAGPLRVMWLAGPEALAATMRMLQPLAIGLMDELVSVVLCCPEDVDVGELGGGSLEIVRFGHSRVLGHPSASVRKLVERIRRDGIELVHSLDAGVSALARKVAAEANVLYAVTSLRIGDGRRIAGLENSAAIVLPASTTIRQDLQEHGAASAECTQLIRPGVYRTRNPTCFDGSQRSTAIVAGGDMGRQESFDALLRTFLALREKEMDCVFFLIGGGAAERRIRRRAEKLGLLHDVTFVDSQSPSQFSGIIKAADVYVSVAPPPQIDTQTLLAMGAGSAVLCAPDPAADFMLDGKTAVLFKAGDADDLTANLRTLLGDPAGARALAEGALEYVGLHHSAAGAVSAVAHVYRMVTARTAVVA